MSSSCNPPALADFSHFAEAFLNLRRSGDQPSLEEAVAMFPHLEREIRQRLPAMLLLHEAYLDDDRYVNLKPGDKIAGCKLHSEIGRGSFGTVFKAFQASLSRFVAVKAIRLNPALEVQMNRFAIECKTMAQLDHPNIVSVFGFEQTAEAAFLIMRLVDGHSLTELMSAGADYRARYLLSELRSDWTAFAGMAREIAGGLAHAHQHGVIHRDIKPSNLILDKSGTAWITDFGLAKLTDQTASISMTGEVIGTPKYMSPEQLRGDCDARSDLYALGLTLSELAFGDVAACSSQAGESQTARTPNNTENPMPEELKQVLLKSCAYAPEDRFQTAEELVVVLDRFLAGKKKPDRRKGKRLSDEEFKGLFRKRILLTAVASVLFFGICTFFLTRSADREDADTNLVESIANDPSSGLTEFLKEETKEYLTQAGAEMGLEENERAKLVARFDDMFEAVEQATKKAEAEGAPAPFSSISISARIMYLNGVIERSSLNAEEKSHAHFLIRKFAYVASRMQVSAEKANRWIDALSGNKRVKVGEFRQLSPPRKQLEAWLASLQNMLSEFDIDSSQVNSVVDTLLSPPPEADTSADELPHSKASEIPVDQLLKAARQLSSEGASGTRFESDELRRLIPKLSRVSEENLQKLLGPGNKQ